MDVKLLEAFRAVVENKSVTAAARVLGVTQPAVSAQIGRLEAQTGLLLFNRSAGRLKLSEDGQRFYEEVRNVLGSLDQLVDIAANIRSGEVEALTVASNPGVSTALMPTVMTALMRKRPTLKTRMIHRNSEEVEAIFDAGGADLAVTEWPITVRDVITTRYRLGCVAIVPRGHPLAARPALDAADLAPERIIAMSEARLVGHTIRSAFRDANLPWAPVLESEFFSTMCGLVASGAGVAVVDAMSAGFFSHLGLEVRPFTPVVEYELVAFRRKPPGANPAVDDLLALLGEEIRALAAPLPPTPSNPNPSNEDQRG